MCHAHSGCILDVLAVGKPCAAETAEEKDCSKPFLVEMGSQSTIIFLRSMLHKIWQASHGMSGICSTAVHLLGKDGKGGRRECSATGQN